MGINYPLTLPSSPKPSRISFRAVSAVAVSRSPYTYRSFYHEHDGQAWAAEVTLPPMTRAQVGEWQAFILACHGIKGSFRLGDPSYSGPQGIALGSGRLGNENELKGATAIETANWAPNIDPLFLPGDLIQIGDRLHRVINRTGTDGSGVANLEIWPGLRTNSIEGTNIITINPTGLFRLASNQAEVFEADAEGYYYVNFQCVEAL